MLHSTFIMVAALNINHLSQQLHSVFAKFPEILAVYLYGSHVEGRARADSDIDLGVVSSEAASSELRIKLLSLIVDLGIDRVDLVFLNESSALIRHAATMHNSIVYSREEFDPLSYQLRAVKEYTDMLPIYKLPKDLLKERLNSGH